MDTGPTIFVPDRLVNEAPLPANKPAVTVPATVKLSELGSYVRPESPTN